MSPAQSPEFRAHRYTFTEPVVDKTVTPPPSARPVSTAQSSGSTFRDGFSSVLVALAVVALIALLTAAILSGWLVDFLSVFSVRPPVQTPPVTSSVTPCPTVVSVVTPCPDGCVPASTLSDAGADQPVVVVVPYPVFTDRVVEAPKHYGGHAGHGGRYEPIEHNQPMCPSQSWYVVRPGDTVYRIARQWGVDPAAIVQASGLWNPNYIQVGQVLAIPCAPAYWYGDP